MNVIYRYTLEPPEPEAVSSPQLDVSVWTIPGEVLSVHERKGNICIWVRGIAESSPIRRVFRVVPTGERCDVEGFPFLGTVFLDCGTLVLHIFDKTEKS
jgi:hypothetical protein